MSTSSKPVPFIVKLLALTMGSVFLAFMALFIFSELGAAKKRAWRWGYLNVSGELAIPLQFEVARAFHNGRAAVQIKGRWGFIDHGGTLVVAARYAKVCDYGGAQPTCALDLKTRDWGYLDDAGAWALKPRWRVARAMTKGVAAVGRSVGFSSTRVNNSVSHAIIHFGLINRAGVAIVAIRPNRDPLAWTTARPWSEGLMAVQVGHKFGYVDATGRFVISPRYQAANAFLGGYAGVSTGRGWAVIDRRGATVIAAGVYLVGGASHGLIAGPGRYYQGAGRPIGSTYDQVLPHSDGLGAVYSGQRKGWGFVDTSAKEVIPLRYRRVSPFANGRAMAAVTDGLQFVWGVIDRRGAWVVQPVWSGVDERGYAEGLVAVGRAP